MAGDGAFVGVRVQGGLLPSELLSRLSAGRNVAGLTSADYGLAHGESVREAANRVWAYLTGVWSSYRSALEQLPEGDRATSLTRDRWLQIVLEQLGYGRVPTGPAGGVRAGDKAFPVSHVWQSVPVHMLGVRIDLDRRTAGVAGAAGQAPQSMMQELLNRSDEHLWAILSNGSTLRLLRDSTSLVGAAYLEFDLEAIFDGELFSDFLLLYTVCHSSRLAVRDPEVGPASCWMEQWRDLAFESGSRALNQLREGVVTAIEILGAGFLGHPDNAALRERYESGEVSKEDFNHALLRVVYRLLFSFVAEDRGALLSPHADPAARQRYDEYFSTARLRATSRRRRGGRHSDRWRALQIVWSGLGSAEGRPELGIAGIGGLFDPGPLDVVTDASLSNEALLTAVRSLSVITEKGTGFKRVVNHRDLGAEELGSIYEALLEYVPSWDPTSREYRLGDAAGNVRKTTGSYYTPTSLIESLLDSALDPVLDEAEKSATDAADTERRLLEVTVCDPACGSGHFLVAAGRRIAKRVAKARTGDPEPPPEQVRTALRDVVGRCIYGVDVNPLAAELAKVSLWLEAMEPGRPLAFLDAQIKVGNALVGTTPALLDQGIPQEAFKPIEGDDKAVASALAKRNKDEAGGQGTLFGADEARTSNAALVERAADLVGAALSLADIHVKQQRLRAYETSSEYRRQRHAADAWCAAFVWHKTHDAPEPITNAVFQRLRTSPVDPNMAMPQNQEVERLAAQYRFFHWHLEFPHLFQTEPPDSEVRPNGITGWYGGFDVMLGNPPWDTLSPDAKEFFSGYDPRIREVAQAEQKKIVESLIAIPEVMKAWSRHRRQLFGAVHFMKSSGRYRYFAPGNLGKGDFNTYRMFVETSLHLAGPVGSVAQIVPAGLYGGANASALRRELIEHWDWRLLLGLINTREHWFPGVASATRFCAYAAKRGGPTKKLPLMFGIESEEGLRVAARDPIYMPISQIIEQSPLALAISEVRDADDVRLVEHVHAQWKAWGAQAPDLGSKYQREIDMGNDRDLFGELSSGLPLYEGRMIDQFDHRAKAWRSGRGRGAKWETLAFASLQKGIHPQWRVSPSDVPKKLGDRVDLYRVGFGDVTSPTNERSVIAALIPPGTICGHKVPTITFSAEHEWAYMPWLAVANSFVFDFLARKKIALSLTYTVLDSLPFPDLTVRSEWVERISRLALRLTCTSADMTDYWNANAKLGWCDAVPQGTTPPGLIDDEARGLAKAIIEVEIALELGLARRQVEFILDTFPSVARKDIAVYGDYRTKRLILEIYDQMAEAQRTGTPYQSPIDDLEVSL